MNIQCIALDLDKTTLNRQGVLSPGNRAALEYAIGRGVHVVIASGRAFSTLPQDVLSVPGIEYAITSNGAAVYHVPSGRCLRRFLLRPESTERILALTAREPVTYEAFVSGRAYASQEYIDNPLRFGATPEALQYVRKTRRMERDIVGFIRAHIHELDCIDLVVGNPDDHRRLWQQLREAVPGVYITSSVRQLLEISDAKSGKHAGVAYLAQLLSLPREAIAAFGDGDNDADLLRYAGCGIAMANATPACLAAADRVTAAHWEDGVAQGIYELLK